MTEKTLLLPVGGLQPDLGPFTTAPQGALTDAKNVQLRTPGAIEPRGSYTFMTPSALDTSDFHYQHVSFNFDTQYFVAHSENADGTNGFLVQNSSLVIDTPSTTSYTPGEVYFSQAGTRGYYTSNQGVQVLYSEEEDPDLAWSVTHACGLARPTWKIATTAGGTALPDNYCTAYRVVVARNGVAGTVYLSPPSGRWIVYANGGAVDPSITVQVSSEDYQEGDEIQIYRSVIAATPYTAQPTDEMRLRFVQPITSAILSAGFVDFTDKKADDTWSGAALYTNATQEGISQTNWRPGYAGTLEYFNGMMFYGNVRSRERFTVTCSTLGSQAPYDESFGSYNFTSGAAVALAATTVTGVSATDIARIIPGQFISEEGAGYPYAGSTCFSPYTKIVTVGATSFTIDKPAIAADATLSLIAWDWLCVTDGGVDYYVYPSCEASVGVFTAPGFAAEYGSNSVTPVATGIESAFNKANAPWYDGVSALPSLRVYGDNTNSTSLNLGVQYVFESKTVDGPAFTVKSSKPKAFSRPLDNTVGLTSTKDFAPGWLSYSKAFQPEAVPLDNYVIVGSETEKILRLVSTRDSLWVFKTDGLWRITGDSPATIRIDSFDPNCRLSSAAPQLVTTYGNDVYVWAKGGLYRVNDGGVVPIDQGIRQYLLETIGDLADTVSPYALASYSGRWVMFRPTSAGEGRQYVYWPDTDAWTYWIPPANFQTAGGIVANENPQPLFAGGSFTAGYQLDDTTIAPSYDEVSLVYDGFGVPVTIDVAEYGPYGYVTHDVLAVTGYEVQVGDAFLDVDGNLLYVQALVDSVSCILTSSAGLGTSGTANYLRAFPCRVMWSAIPGAGLGLQSHFTKATFAFDRVRGGENFTYEFDGYQNVGVVTDPELYVPLATDNSEYGWTTGGKPAVEQRPVPRNGPRRDWGIKVGFSTQQAGQYFRTNGIAVAWEPVGDKVTR